MHLTLVAHGYLNNNFIFFLTKHTIVCITEHCYNNLKKRLKYDLRNLQHRNALTVILYLLNCTYYYITHPIFYQ